MARALAGLPAGIRVSDHISLGVIAGTFPLDQVQQILAETGRASERERDLPAQVMVYYTIALALYMGAGTREVLRCLLEGLRWLQVRRRSGWRGAKQLSQARTPAGCGAAVPAGGWYDRSRRPPPGALYRMWQLVGLDGSCLDVADTEENCTAFGRPEASRGESAFPQLRFVALVENGTHVLFGARLGSFADGETTLAYAALPVLSPACCAWPTGSSATRSGRRPLLRVPTCSGGVKRNLRLPREAVLLDGST